MILAAKLLLGLSDEQIFGPSKSLREDDGDPLGPHQLANDQILAFFEREGELLDNEPEGKQIEALRIQYMNAFTGIQSSSEVLAQLLEREWLPGRALAKQCLSLDSYLRSLVAKEAGLPRNAEGLRLLFPELGQLALEEEALQSAGLLLELRRLAQEASSAVLARVKEHYCSQAMSGMEGSSGGFSALLPELERAVGAVLRQTEGIEDLATPGRARYQARPPQLPPRAFLREAAEALAEVLRGKVVPQLQIHLEHVKLDIGERKAKRNRHTRERKEVAEQLRPMIGMIEMRRFEARQDQPVEEEMMETAKSGPAGARARGGASSSAAARCRAGGRRYYTDAEVAALLKED